ncbi:hypothetical protein Btru_015598 [Bulinus truncatus]|nr:hypothetical protein Btru_015598 [Bulinus truncatus]
MDGYCIYFSSYKLKHLEVLHIIFIARLMLEFKCQIKNDFSLSKKGDRMYILLRFRSPTLLQIIVVVLRIAELLCDKDTDKLLARLKDNKWPWFGENYIKRVDCHSENISTVECFNLRRDFYESILQRANLKSDIVLTKKLRVTFSAEMEGVDVCGKTTILEAVKPFDLSPEGLVTHLNGEDYRNQPKLLWEADDNVLYTVIYYDVGLLKMRGWWYDVKKQSDGNLIGKINLVYQPPANPTPNENPILIVLLQQTHPEDLMSEFVDKACIHNNPSVSDADLCRMNFKDWTMDMIVVGLQVYYTNGQSMYEKYRACTESYPCDPKCIEKFKKYTTDPERPIKFLDLERASIDHYVNFQFYTLTPLYGSDLPTIANIKGRQKTAPGRYGEPRYVNARPRPGDDMQLRNSDTLLTSNPMRINMNLEIGAPIAFFNRSDLKYSIIIVNQNATGMSSTPFGHYYIANLQFPDLFNTGEELQSFREFEAPDGVHRYHILLFSHTVTVNDKSDVCATYSCQGWDLRKLSQDHELRGVSWLRASNSDDIKCPVDGQGGCLAPQPYSSPTVGSHFAEAQGSTQNPTNMLESTKVSTVLETTRAIESISSSARTMSGLLPFACLLIIIFLHQLTLQDTSFLTFEL